jgi:hypothetical protein
MVAAHGSHGSVVAASSDYELRPRGRGRWTIAEGTGSDKVRWMMFRDRFSLTGPSVIVALLTNSEMASFEMKRRHPITTLEE